MEQASKYGWVVVSCVRTFSLHIGWTHVVRSLVKFLQMPFLSKNIIVIWITKILGTAFMYDAFMPLIVHQVLHLGAFGDDPFWCFGVRARLKVASSNEEGENLLFLMEFVRCFSPFLIWELKVACLSFRHYLNAWSADSYCSHHLLLTLYSWLLFLLFLIECSWREASVSFLGTRVMFNKMQYQYSITSMGQDTWTQGWLEFDIKPKPS